MGGCADCGRPGFLLRPPTSVARSGGTPGPASPARRGGCEASAGNRGAVASAAAARAEREGQRELPTGDACARAQPAPQVAAGGSRGPGLCALPLCYWTKLNEIHGASSQSMPAVAPEPAATATSGCGEQLIPAHTGRTPEMPGARGVKQVSMVAHSAALSPAHGAVTPGFLCALRSPSSSQRAAVCANAFNPLRPGAPAGPSCCSGGHRCLSSRV